MHNDDIKEVCCNYEKLNKEYLNLSHSAEYQLGKNLKNLMKNVKHFHFAYIFNKVYVKNHIKKYNGENNVSITCNENIDFSKAKIAIYTCLTGNYDCINQPLIQFPNVDYILFTNNDNLDAKGWIKKSIQDSIKIGDNVLINRYLKMHPYELFHDDYDYVIYLDSNIEVIGDIRKFIQATNDFSGLAISSHNQRNCTFDEIECLILCHKGNKLKLKEFRDFLIKENFPKHFGLYECNIIVSKMDSVNGEKILNDWWNIFFESNTFRDQIELPYVVWKNGYKFSDIGTICKNVYLNEKVRFHEHVK